MLIDSKEIARRTGEHFSTIRKYIDKIHVDGETVFPQHTSGVRGGKNKGVFWDSELVDKGYKRIIEYREQAKKDKLIGKSKQSADALMDMSGQLPFSHKLADTLFNKPMAH